MGYDQGSVFSPEILDITDDDIKDKFMAGVANVAAVCLEIGYPTIASAPHSIANGMKNHWPSLPSPRSPSRRLRCSRSSSPTPASLLLQLLQQRLRKKRRKRMMTWDSVFLTRTFQLNLCI